MKGIIKREWLYVLGVAVFTSCSNESAEKKFEVSGVITNTKARIIYLEESQAGSLQGTVVDSFLLKDGRYRLETTPEETQMYGLRLDNSQYAVAYVINDVPSFTFNIEMDEQDSLYAKKYEVSGSPANQAMQDFVSQSNDDLQKIRSIILAVDSLGMSDAPDSLIRPLISEGRAINNRMKNFTLTSIQKANNPALVIFELGYYKAAAERYGLDPMDLAQQSAIVNRLAQRYPSHKGVQAVKKNLDEEIAQQNNAASEPKWTGKPAPDFSLPDVDGNLVSLSSFRGKYVLVDFWASWCKPCRNENPNIVKAYNQFRDKNFTVLGVSLDRPGQKDKWVKAIKQDNLTWTQVSDLQFWNSRVVSLYHFDEIPYNLLINPEGIVVAENLIGEPLIAKLEELL